MLLTAVVINLIVMTQTIMSRVAVDTNILLYALDDFYPDKQAIAINLIADRPHFCSQSLSEFTNVCLRRWKISKAKTANLIQTYLEQCIYVPVTEVVILDAIRLMNKYDFQLFDSMIVAAALNVDCDILYSEDMADGLRVEGNLTIVNPFK